MKNEFVEECAKKRRMSAIMWGGGTERLTGNPFMEDTIGAYGEYAFAKEFNLPFNSKVGPDKGYDFQTKIGKIDIKTSKTPINMLVKVNDIKKHVTDIYVLAGIRKDNSIYFVGWEYAKEMEKCPVKQFNPVLPECHYKHSSKIRPMEEIREMLK